ncbi:MAG: tRNA (guanosine(46)-N7)-methyltransferase TrmB [Chloroflexaceae bacterium]|nr:tRNA (guanosine(46)-N7)-methyltransferase TrmB [Chloroflexaceae bacterium]
MSKLRVRQHVNPLSVQYQQAISAPDWQAVYQQSEQPLHLDIGCARGRFLLQMAQAYPERNFLGVEIRHSLVEAARQEQQALGLGNLCYLFGNINFQSESLLASLPGQLQWVTIQFPDPWFKKRHGKRRVAQPELVAILGQYVVAGGTVFVQSDVLPVAQEMEALFREHPAFEKQHHEPWLETNPMLFPTERELYVLALGKPVYRALFHKRKVAVASGVGEAQGSQKSGSK